MTYRLLCDHCGYRRITDGTDIGDLREVKTSAIPRGSPKLDPLAKKTVVPNFGMPGTLTTGTTRPDPVKQRKKFKCPGCGFVISAKKYVTEEQEKPRDQADNTDGREGGTPGPAVP